MNRNLKKRSMLSLQRPPKKQLPQKMRAKKLLNLRLRDLLSLRKNSMSNSKLTTLQLKSQTKLLTTLTTTMTFHTVDQQVQNEFKSISYRVYKKKKGWFQLC